MANIIKKCFFISTEFYPGPGGIGSHAFNLINNLKKFDWEFIVCTNQDNSSEEEIKNFNESYCFPIIRLRETPSMLQLIRKIGFIIKEVRKSDARLLIASGKHAAWFGYFAKLFTRIPLVTIAHGTELADTGRMNKRAYQNADLMIAVSNYTLQFARKNKLHPRNSCVIYNGADNMKFFPLDMTAIRQFKSQQQIQDEKIIITIGNVSERKGQQSVIQSLPIVLRSLPNVHYYCIGLPSESERLIELAKNLNIQDHVHFLGKLPETEVLKWLNASDIFAMTSVHTTADDFEGFGISVIEAALCKKPAIVTNSSSGVIESIVEGETGIGVAEKDYQEIADAILKLLTDKSYCTSMGDKAFNRAITQCTWEIQSGTYNGVLTPLLAG